MGKGDQKTRRGKITAGSYGKTRPKKSSKVGAAKVKVEKTVEVKAETTPKKVAKTKSVSEDKPAKPATKTTKKTEE